MKSFFRFLFHNSLFFSSTILYDRELNAMTTSNNEDKESTNIFTSSRFFFYLNVEMSENIYKCLTETFIKYRSEVNIHTE